MSNLINEELEKMKYLFGYQKGKVVSEQVTQASPVVPTAPDVIMKIQRILVDKYKANLGNSGPKGDGVDGKWGNLTQTAFETVTKGIKPSVTQTTAAPVAAAPAAAPAASAPAAAAPAAAAPAAAAPAAAAPAAAAPAAAAPAAAAPAAAPAAAAPKSNRELRRDRQDLRRANKREMQDLRAQQKAQQ